MVKASVLFGAGGLPIGIEMPIHMPRINVNLPYTDEYGRVWLRTGLTYYDFDNEYSEDVRSKDYTAYNYWSHTGATGLDNCKDAAFDPVGNRVFILDWTDDMVWVIDYPTKAVVTSFSVNAQETNPQGITWDGTHIVVVGNTADAFVKYLPDGTFVSSTPIGTFVQPDGIIWDGTHYWVMDSNTTVYKFDASLTYTGFSFAAPANSTSLAWDGDTIWTLVQSTGVWTQHYTDGTLVPNAGTLSNAAVAHGGCFIHKGFFLMAMNTAWLKMFPQKVGQPASKTAGDTLWMRIK